MLWVYIGVSVLVIFLIWVMVKKNSVKEVGGANNVIELNKKLNKKQKTAKGQVCSFCRNKTDRLAFYSDEQGKVLGLCNSCKLLAENRGLLRL
ncbi:hypothetical protein [Paenibacillus alkalitolerans]|uniref:hypothetical protein n=1 Tax=Paenibacillus alkalitolerans TaxID=2799335 RepID=UPI0018F63B01|nr:hypothetical protein [Paenibacillus alkalitolerans]